MPERSRDRMAKYRLRLQLFDPNISGEKYEKECCLYCHDDLMRFAFDQ